jgi:hypothetical protein
LNAVDVFLLLLSEGQIFNGEFNNESHFAKKNHVKMILAMENSPKMSTELFCSKEAKKKNVYGGNFESFVKNDFKQRHIAIEES